MSLKSILMQLGKTAVREYLNNKSRQSGSAVRTSRTTRKSGMGGLLDTVLQTMSGRGGGSTSAPTIPGTWRDVTAAGHGGATRDLTAAELRQLRIGYAPQLDGDPDPGEVVWTWVPYVENDGRGKDRPILIIGTLPDGAVAGCYLTSTPHREYVHLGTGNWDKQGRDSYLNPERLLRVTRSGMRREGSAASQQQFERALGALRSIGML